MEMLLDSSVMKLVMSSEFAKKQRFKLKKIERPIYVRNINSSFNKEKSICYKLKTLELVKNKNLVLE